MKYLEERNLSYMNSILYNCKSGDRVINGRIEAFSCKKAGNDKRLAKTLESLYQREMGELQQDGSDGSEYQAQIQEKEQENASDNQGQAIPIGSHGSWWHYSPRMASSAPGSLSLPTSSSSSFLVPSPSQSSSSSSSIACCSWDKRINMKGLSPSPIGSLMDSSTRKLLINLITTMNASFPDYDFTNVKPEQFEKEPNVMLVINTINTYLADFVEASKPGFLEQMWTAISDSVQLDACEVFSYLSAMEDSGPFSEGNLWSFNYFFYNKSMKKILYFTCIAKSAYYGNDENDEIMEDIESNENGYSESETFSDSEFILGSEWEDEM